MKILMSLKRHLVAQQITFLFDSSFDDLEIRFSLHIRKLFLQDEAKVDFLF